ncbi:hypothetical protein [Microbispora sp. NPDC049125]|uniref:hypothetical protein n=1 Tax=Microbispora sp. NPDC049125 TaxID=3154929 RepID=UPI003466BDFD
MADSGSQPAQGHVPAAETVEGALAPLGRLTAAPVPEHVGIFEEVLSGLEAVLASVDDSVDASAGHPAPASTGDPVGASVEAPAKGPVDGPSEAGR